MKIALPIHSVRTQPQSTRGSLLIIVLWITFGLISLALYFGHSVMFELRASDQTAAGVEAEQAIEGAARYISFALTNAADLGHFPDTNFCQFEAVPVGNATYWVIGRTNTGEVRYTPVYGLVDEASKLNLNTVTIDMLQTLPNMTAQFAAAIIDWRDTDEDMTTGGAESDYYLRLNPPYRCKNAPFESIDELRLVAYADQGLDPSLNLLFGEDANLNGVLDPNENDGLLSLPYDNRDGRLDSGLFEYVTVWSREPNTNAGGTNRIDVTSTDTQQLSARMQELFGQQRATEIQARLTGTTSVRSLVEFFIRSGMTADEFDRIYDDLSVTNAAYVEGLININTASEAVLACIPGIGIDKTSQVTAYRQSQSGNLNSVAWIVSALDQTSAIQAGPYITTRSYQFSADVVALGHHQRGYRRTWFVFDTSEGSPKIIYRRDRARLGWALGDLSRQTAAVANNNRTWHF